MERLTKGSMPCPDARRWSASCQRPVRPRLEFDSMLRLRKPGELSLIMAGIILAAITFSNDKNSHSNDYLQEVKKEPDRITMPLKSGLIDPAPLPSYYFNPKLKPTE